MTAMRKANFAFITTCWIIFAVVMTNAEYIPPKQKLARSLNGNRIAEAVSNIPEGNRFSVPISSTREWSASNTWYSSGDICSVSGTSVWVCVQGHTSQPDITPQQAPELWRAVPSATHDGGEGK